MEYNDRLKTEIERLGQVLKAVMDAMAKLRNDGQITEAMAHLETEMLSQSNFDLREIQAIRDPEDLQHYIEANTDYKSEHYNTLSEMLTAYAESPYLTPMSRGHVLMHALFLLNQSDIDNHTWSMDKSRRKQHILELLKENHHDADDH